MTCAGASELGVSQWASLFTEKALGVSKAVGDIFGPCLFGVMMGVGRTVYGIYGHKVRMTRVLCLSAILCIISYVMTAMCQSPVLSLLGCALCGLSVSLMWPGMLSMASQTFKTGGAAMFSMMALFGDVGCSLGPWLVSVISETTEGVMGISSLRFGILSAGVFPLVMLLGIIYFGVNRKKID